MKRKLLYITAVQPENLQAELTEATRSVISVLARDFEISLAVAGSATSQELSALRADLGVVRVAGGFDLTDNDTPVDPELKLLLESMGVSPFVNARLKAAIQRRAADFESVFIDTLAAVPYLPLGVSGQTVFIAQRIESEAPSLSKGLLGSRRVKRVRRYEHASMSRCDRVFSTSDVAKGLLGLGLPLGKLVDESTSLVGSS